MPRSNRTSTELSWLLSVTIEDVVHEDDLRRIRPLKAVVPFDGAVNWSSHHGTDREYAPAAHRTRCISVELKQPVFHTNTTLAEAKRERLLDKVSATSTRTAEVAICIIPERLPDRPQQLPDAWETQVVEDDVHNVIAQGIEMFCSW